MPSRPVYSWLSWYAFPIYHKLTENVPYGAQVTIDGVDVSAGWECPPNQPYIKELLVAASERSFGKPALGLNEGGSIPLMTTLQNLYCL
jgi:hypothetical protein